MQGEVEELQVEMLQVLLLEQEAQGVEEMVREDMFQMEQ